MHIEAVDQSKLWVFKVLLLGVALAFLPDFASAEERKESHASVWGPMFRSQVQRCWKKPYGGDATVEASLRIKLTRDGSLMEEPSADSAATSDYVAAYQKSAIKALNASQPYRLPIEYYDEWKHFVPVFSERDRKASDGPFSTRTPSICRGC